MDIALIVIGAILLIVGFIGCIAPILPGPPMAYFSLILLQLTRFHPFSSTFLVVWAAVIIIVSVLDYYVPIWGTKKFGGTKGGQWGATLGLIIGLFFSPMGILLGPFLGAFAGEILNKQDVRTALRSAIGSFIGFLAGTLMKLIVCGLIAFYFIRELISTISK